jgi:hypothetical protein
MGRYFLRLAIGTTLARIRYNKAGALAELTQSRTGWMQ